MKKKCQVVMLPTEKATNHCITKSMTSGKLFYNPTEKMARIHSINEGASIYHLYFLSDEEIKEGDWVFNPNWVLRQCKKIYKTKYHFGLTLKDDYKHIWALSKCHKIISSTDESLGLPRPSNEFLKAYCEVYNSNPITEVNIEYNDIYIDSKTGKPITYWGFETDMLIEEGTILPQKISKLKVAPDNTITISKVEERMFTLEELTKLVKSAWYTGRDRGKYKEDLQPSYENEVISKWLKDKLK